MTTEAGRRERGLPVGVGPTLLLLVAAVAVILTFLWVRDRRQEQPIVLPGPLLQVPVERISGLIFTRQGGQYRFDRDDEGVWSLSGATSDFVDDQAVEHLLEELAAAPAGAVLPGTEPEDERYEFNTPEAMRLSIFTVDGELQTLAVGTHNPVTGNFYASGLRRAGCFMIAAEQRQTLAELPRSVELGTLLPAVSDTALTRIQLWRGRTEHDLERREGRWWLKVPPQGVSLLSAKLAAYDRYYADRIRHEADGDWALASDADVRALVFETTRSVVKEIKPVVQTADWRTTWGLDQPWRTVRFHGPGINPDPADRSPDAMELAFGAPLSTLVIPVQRREVVLTADGDAYHTLEQPLGELALQTALTRKAMDASALEIRRGDFVVVSGEKTEDPWDVDGRELWRTLEPSPVDPSGKESTYGAGEFIVEMDRMPMLQALPPVTSPSPLQDRERVVVTLTYPGAEKVIFQVGFLTDVAKRNLPDAPADPDPIGMWYPDTGKLLQVNDFLVVTSRSFANR